MVGTVRERDFEIHDGEAGLRARVEAVVDAFLDGGNVFLRNVAAFDFVDEFVAAAGLLRFKREDDMGVLSMAARLFLR